MATDKRDRQRANREQKKAEEAKKAKRAHRLGLAKKYGFYLAIFVIAIVVLQILTN